jgi:hypothetical protein
MPPRSAAPATDDDGECVDGLPTLEDVIKGFILPSGGAELNGFRVLYVMDKMAPGL